MNGKWALSVLKVYTLFRDAPDMGCPAVLSVSRMAIRGGRNPTFRINLQQNFSKQPCICYDFLFTLDFISTEVFRDLVKCFSPQPLGQYSVWLKPPMCLYQKPGWTLQKKIVNQFRLAYEILNFGNKIILCSDIAQLQTLRLKMCRIYLLVLKLCNSPLLRASPSLSERENIISQTSPLQETEAA